MANAILLSLSLLFLVVALQCCGAKGFSPISRKLERERFLQWQASRSLAGSSKNSHTSDGDLPVFVSPQDGLKQHDKIARLPGQPNGVDFNQYSGYVTVDQNAGRALFYYFVESPKDSCSKPLVLWVNHSPGCSSVGQGAFTELGSFRVNKDGKTLYQNPYAWNNEANIIFLESHPGAGFSYSNKSSDHENIVDRFIAHDSYVFLINWLERFPEYKTRDFFIAGERYAGHFAPQLAQLIVLHNNNDNTNHTKVNLKRVIVGNGIIDYESLYRGSFDYAWTHGLISDETYMGAKLYCNFTSFPSDACNKYVEEMYNDTTKINIFDIYSPFCNSTSASSSISNFDPCSDDYVFNYLNNPVVQIALHVDIDNAPFQWELCNYKFRGLWIINVWTVLPIITELMESGVQFWLYSGDTDSFSPVTSTKYAINKLGLQVKTPWYPWYLQNEVGGFVVEYQNLTFVTIRGAGLLVPSYQPARALALFSSFISGKLLPSS